MANKNIYSRMQQKHDVQANWEKAINFIPLEGEIIVYDPDENNLKSRIKIGDGKTNINNLAFIESSDDVITATSISNALGYSPVNPSTLSLGIHTDGLAYLFINNIPVGNGIELPSGGATGDVVGYIDSDNNIILSGALADGQYNIKYEMEDGSTIDIGDLVLDSTIYYSITNTLTKCTTNNNVLQVASGNSYSATIAANSGYSISSITVKMGGTDITASAVNGNTITIGSVTGNVVITAVATEIIYYSITNNLTNCTNSNSAARVVENSSYSATISVNDGYEMSSITVKMGSTDITSSAVSGNNITINKVTGNVVITAVAEEIELPYTNLADPTSADWKNGYRLNSSGGVTAATAATTATNFIGPVHEGDIIRIYGIDLTINDSIPYKSDKTVTNAGSSQLINFNNLMNVATNVTATTTGGQLTVGSFTEIQGGYWRFSGPLVGTPEDVIITINETFDGTADPVQYSITNTLTQCSTNNSATQVAKDASYSATITANDGYKMSSIKVTMGGTDISASAVSGGNITIGSVTGNVVITAVAVEAGAAYTNQIPKSKDASGNPYNGGQGWKTGYRLSGSSGNESAQTGTEVTGFIPFKYSDTIRLKNIKDSDNSHVIAIYDSSHAKIYTSSYSALLAGTSLTMDGRIIELKIGVGNFVNSALTESNVAYLRVSASEITNDSIITINEEITD